MMFIPSDKFINELFKVKNELKDTSWGIEHEEMNERDFIKGMCCLSGASWGKRVENRIANELGYTIISSRISRGDMISQTGKYIEIKASILTPSNHSLNMVQIRLNQKIDWYLCIAYDIRCVENFSKYVYLLTHNQMIEECKLFGGYAHGTKGDGELDTKREVRMSVSFDKENKHRNRWNDYIIPSIESVRDKVDSQ